ncbi:phosphatase PAP2 family protein [Terrihabitans soli]|uniref:Phosphatase PAP2 family protein n=1 Tax=Terrihabitans soli TaxID=708113 RepID=A0A6S6QW65_9HYPH|nr:phosphatase PAP2 family protein [Terrihabitans soli]BCJ91291.1 phosphatase PAP2 family protein [Terrihabitans soli]
MRGLIGAGALVAAFAAIAVGIHAGAFDGFDRALLLSLRTGDTHDPAGPQWVETFFLDITGLGSWTIVSIVTLAATGFLIMQKRRGTAWLLIAAVAGGTLLNNLLKFFFERARPDLVAHAVETQTSSFPSGHAMMSAVAYLTLGALLARTQKRLAARLYIVAASVLVTVLVGVSRVYLGVHWPSDVLAGWCMGGAWALICWHIAERLQQSGDIEKPRG